MVFLDIPDKLLLRSKHLRARSFPSRCAGKIFMQERWLSVEEIAEHLGVNPDTIYKWVVRKKMPAHKLGRLWKFLASEVDSWVKAGRAAQKAERKKPARKKSNGRTSKPHSQS